MIKESLENNVQINEEIIAFQDRLLKWYDGNARVLPWRNEPTPYRVWVSEIMLQQTRVDTVIPYFERFLEALPTVKDLAEVSDERLMKLWEGLGYYSRGRNLKKAAQKIMEEHHGEIPGTISELMELPGIGPYTAGAVGSIAFGVLGAAIDGNVNRVVLRLMGSFGLMTEQKVKKEIEVFVMERLSQERIGAFNQAMMELGATVCLPNGMPKCEKCPVRELCKAYENGSIEQIPVKKPKKARRVEEKTMLIMEHHGRIGLKKRPSEGLLSGLWEFPNLEGHYSKEECLDLLENEGIHANSITSMGTSKHIFSHIEWHMTGFYVDVDRIETSVKETSEAEEPLTLESMEGIHFIDRKALKTEYPIPTAYRFYQNKLFELEEE